MRHIEKLESYPYLQPQDNKSKLKHTTTIHQIFTDRHSCYAEENKPH